MSAGGRVSFLSLSGLGLAALVAPLVLLYVLKVERTRIRVPSTWLWAAAARDLTARSPWKRLFVQLPLIVQALALVAMAIAAARPASTGTTIIGDHVAIVVDTSASMAASEGDVTRLDLARRAAHGLVDALPPGSDAMILDAGREPRIAMPADRDVRRMHAALDALAVREVEGDLAASVALASARLGALTGNRRLYVITDGALARPAALRGAVPLEVIRVGKPKSNAAIVRVDVRAGHDAALDRAEVQAFLMIANAGTERRELYVTMKQRGASDTLASRKLALEPGERAPVVLTFAPAPGDRGSGLVFELSPSDALPSDDVAYARVPPGREIPVVIASSRTASPWLERVFASDADAEVTRGPVVEALRDVPEDALVVVDGACPSTVPGGDVWIVDPPAGRCFDVEVGEPVERPQVTSWDEADPRMRFLVLDDVFIERARALVPASRRQAIVRGPKGPLVVDASTSSRSITLSAFDVADSDWPYKPSFVVFARNMLEEARLHRAAAAAGMAVTGDAVRVRVPLGVREVEVAGPKSDTVLHLEANAGVVVLPEADRVGFYRVSWSSPTSGARLVPVNLASAVESDLTRELGSESGADTVVDASAVAVAPREHAHVFGLAALALLAFDVWYLTKRTRRGATPRVRGARA